MERVYRAAEGSYDEFDPDFRASMSTVWQHGDRLDLANIWPEQERPVR